MAKCKTCGKNCVKEYCFQHKPRKPLNQKRQEPKPQNPLKRVSDKRKKQEALYSIARKEFLTKNPNCEICGGPATDVHHRNGREGERLNDTEWWMALCRSCHSEVHANPAHSYEMGYMVKG